MTKIEEIEQNINLMSVVIKDAQEALNKYQKALAELKESKKEGKWKPKSAEEYWFRNTDKGEIESVHRYEGDGWDDWRVKNIPIFKTKEECERYWHFMDIVKEKSYEFSKEEWEDTNMAKFIVEYNWYDGSFETACFSGVQCLGTIYFKTKEDAQYIIDNFKDELMEFFL